MKKKIIVICVLLISIYYIFTYPSSDEKYVVLNEIIEDNNLVFHKICVDTKEVPILKSNLSDFSFFNQLSVFTQKILQSSTIEPHKIEYYIKEDNNPHYSKIILNCEKEYEFVYKISLPILSSDKKTALVGFTEDCNCMLGGHGGVYVYKKINDKWKKVNSYHTWIS